MYLLVSLALPNQRVALNSKIFSDCLKIQNISAWVEIKRCVIYQVLSELDRANDKVNNNNYLREGYFIIYFDRT